MRINSKTGLDVVGGNAVEIMPGGLGIDVNRKTADQFVVTITRGTTYQCQSNTDIVVLTGPAGTTSIQILPDAKITTVRVRNRSGATVIISAPGGTIEEVRTPYTMTTVSVELKAATYRRWFVMAGG